MKISITIYQDITQVREAWASYYGDIKKPTRDDLKQFLSALVSSDLEAIACEKPAK